MRISSVVSLAAAVALTAAGTAARAEPLEGRIFLGSGCALYLEKDEGVFTRVLRELSLVNGEVPVVDLSALMISPDQLFLGVDQGLYYKDVERGTLHRVGDWSSPQEVRLAPGVRLVARRTMAELFEGRRVEALAVKGVEGVGPAVAGAEAARFGFWLQRLHELYVPGAMTQAEEADAVLLMRALMGSLPRCPRASAAQGENLKELRAWLDQHPYEEVPALARMLDEIIKGLRLKALHGDLEGGEAATVASLLLFYEQLQDDSLDR